MAGRPKIQFTEELGEDVWKMIQRIQDYYYEADKEELEEEMKRLQDKYPHASIALEPKRMSAGEVVRHLLTCEINRIGD